MRESEETKAVAQRYARRGDLGDRYSMLRPEVWQMVQERERALISLLRSRGHRDLGHLKLTEVGCGAGGNLLELLRLGFSAPHLVGIELLPERFELARQALPDAITLYLRDAVRAPLPAQSQDLVLQSTVFTSLLDRGFQQQLADTMWHWLKPGGAVLWYDFTFDNPNNPDVRGVPLKRVRELFPQGRLKARRVTLAPPLARRVCRIHPFAYSIFNRIPWLRTHVLALIEKPL